MIMNSKFNKFTDTELEREQWRDIAGYDGVYQVSDLGRVRSKKYGRWKMMRFGRNKSGYLSVNLLKNKQLKHFFVHRLVADAFIPNDDETKTQINHRNECKSDNRLWNLEYCTPQYNSTYNDIHLRRKPFIHTKYKLNKVKDLYNPNITCKENLEIFKANGIECSEMVIRCLRRDLGLICNQPKLSKIKELYNPELTINDNIKLFKSNGIECSRNTVLKLRKDLGLTRHYRQRKKTN